MKTILLISIAALGAVAITQSFNGPQLPLKSAREELPEVIIKTRKTNTESFNPALACTRDLPPGATMNNYSTSYEYTDENGEIQVTKHCNKCNAGVYAIHEGEDFKTCSFCGDKE